MTDCSGLQRPLWDNPIRMWWPWKGSDDQWVDAFEKKARARREGGLQSANTPGRLTYEVDLNVIGRDAPVPVRVELYRYPAYFTFNLDPMDYPRVFADEGERSPHRLSDDSLCLFHPGDPKDRRWTADKGLEELLLLVERHLFAEQYWREKGEWPFEEAPHRQKAAS